MIHTLLCALAYPAGVAAGAYLGLKYWHATIRTGYIGPSKMRPVNQREPF